MTEERKAKKKVPAPKKARASGKPSKASRAVPESLRAYDDKRRFLMTPEPPPELGAPTDKPLFVVQKHSASHLHFDFRLEHAGVLKSWAIPQGPTLDPKVRRLAIQTEDHPVAYRDFEGVIPVGEYGGGSVMVWDRGEYSLVSSFEDSVRDGKLDIVLHGQKLKGSFALVRTKERKQWLFIKHQDAHVRRGEAHTPNDRSALTQRTMQEIAEEQSAVWHSRMRNKKAAMPGRLDGFSPMLLTAVDQLPEGDAWQYEPKLDGYRVIAFVTPQGSTLMSRNGVDLTATYPSLARELTRVFSPEVMVLDGELAMTHDGTTLGFEAIQRQQGLPTLFVFDLLLQAGQGLLSQPLWRRQQLLKEAFQRNNSPQLVLSDVLSGSKEQVLAEATHRGWEGVVAKQKESAYEPGVRSLRWVKYKLAHHDLFYVAGLVLQPNEKSFRSLAVARGDASKGLVFAGYVGGGLVEEVRVLLTQKLLLVKRGTPAIAIDELREPIVWVEPCVRVGVRYREILSSGHLRQPILVER